ncbi:MAG TPA: hypothetical protein VHB79_02825 [Polyangiaceae bacterium]|nr:hypothetical protein [Polyangiaceae bacterium]
MKKSAFPAALLLLMLASSGCPVYDRDDGCLDDFDCRDGYACNADTGACVVVTDTNTNTNGNSCSEPRDCVGNETCSRSGTCMAGDCHFASVGCVRGYECSPGSGTERVWHCVAVNTSEGGANAGGADTSGAGGAPQAGAAGANDSGGAP